MKVCVEQARTEAVVGCQQPTSCEMMWKGKVPDWLPRSRVKVRARAPPSAPSYNSAVLESSLGSVMLLTTTMIEPDAHTWVTLSHTPNDGLLKTRAT
ncbi:hypothetical protein RSOLAG1IB_12531 [Rhizoctonia solani AG-1 IB]|uniref:Uncharacterized protein n=1 Tax=Thanatephorus cucumeris (strain AG1-IB / isolate 7/3/14) TaxID=1108050 RepID=A0A0B7G194_THACB|nr:hypothetical protein RSOLAG1IB_12531 [Rhizoctonia solani AG-1 IB]